MRQTPCSAATIRGTVSDLSVAVVAGAPLESATRVIDYELPPTFGLASRARDPRQVQFGLKLVF